jgi:hypothetical protein
MVPAGRSVRMSASRLYTILIVKIVMMMSSLKRQLIMLIDVTTSLFDANMYKKKTIIKNRKMKILHLSCLCSDVCIGNIGSCGTYPTYFQN